MRTEKSRPLFEGTLGLNAILVLLFIYAPIAALVIYSFSASRVAIVLDGFSLAAYERLLGSPQFTDALLNTLVVAILSTLISNVLGTGLAWFLERSRTRLHGPLSALTYLPLFLPEMVFSLALLFFLARIVRPALASWGWGFGSLPAVLAGHVAFSIPYVVLLLRVRLRSFEPAWEEAAHDLGATPWQVFHLLALPWMEPALLGSALLTFALSLDDFYTTYFVSVGGSGFQTLPVYLFTLQSRQGVTTELNALAALILLASLVLVAFSALTQYKQLGQFFKEKHL